MTAKKAPKKILIVDDNDDHLAITKSRLEMENPTFEVDVAHSGEECLEALETDDIDCIISDASRIVPSAPAIETSSLS